jgi:ribosomal-protein-alanine N-acetyltransferase
VVDLEARESASRAAAIPVTWRDGLPTMIGTRVTLRELRMSDGPALLKAITPEITRFTWPAPDTLEGYQRFVSWASRQRRGGTCACFAATLDGRDEAVGVFQLRALDPPAFATAEWGCALASSHWGTGVFREGAELVLSFAFKTVGVRRLEARSVTANLRGNGALRKLGATREGILRGSFPRDGKRFDECLWTILEEDWRHATAAWRPAILQ